MEYRLEINQKLLSAALSQTQGQGPSFSASLKGIHDGETRHDIEVRRISNHQLHLMVDGHRFNAWVERIDGGKIILLDGERYVIYDKDLAAQNHTPSTAMDTTPDIVTPPMPAIVMAVKTQEGEKVAKGDTLVVVSAMKMETTLTAPKDGRVTRISVTEGDKVMPGDILVDIEEDA